MTETFSFTKALSQIDTIQKGINLAATLSCDVPLSSVGLQDLEDAQTALKELKTNLTDAFIQTENHSHQFSGPKPLEEQLKDLQRKFPLTTLSDELIGYRLLKIPEIPLPENKYASAEHLEIQTHTTMYIRVPATYPWEAPDRFFTPSLRTPSGAHPLSTMERGTTQWIPKIEGASMLWFWKITSWNPYQDTLKNYVLAMCKRFEEEEFL